MSPLPSADRWKVLEPLIDAAMDRDPSDRAAFLRDACGADAELAREAMRLLEIFEKRDRWLGTPAVEQFPSLVTGEARIPEVLGARYRSEREIGRGGMATVHLARDLRDERDVAVKVLRHDLGGAVVAERFLAEIRVMARLRHPHILPLEDFGETDGFLYYTMPYVEGESLRQRLRREQRLSIADATRIAGEVAAALDAAHRLDIVHRDIKPENILFRDGSALVADFGIALALSDVGERLTKSGLIIGTPQYMSPEQATGDRAVDRRTDIYALGTLMFEMLAGEPPFTGATVSTVLAKRAAMSAPPVRVLRPTVSVRMDAAVTRALARDPQDRFETAGEFADALRASATESANRDTPETSTTLTRRAPIAFRSRRSAIGAIVLAAAISSIGWMTIRGNSVAHDGKSGILQRLGFGLAPLDTFAYAVIGEQDAAVRASLPDVTEPLRDALRRWQDVAVVEGDRNATVSIDEPVESSTRRTQRVVRAGRYVRLHLTRVLDSLDVGADLFDAKSDARLATAHVRVLAGRAIDGAAMDSLSNALLFRDVMPHVARPDGENGTRFLAARTAFLRGHVALERGDFTVADSEFANAVRYDDQYAAAVLWQGEVRSWIGSADRPWEQLPVRVSRITSLRPALTPADAAILAALVRQAGDGSEDACAAWRDLTAVARYDFAMWYAKANCLRRDSAVVRDARAEGGWRFRSSYQEAIHAYSEAFRLQRGLLRGFGGLNLSELEAIFLTGSAQNRLGRAIRPDTGSFRGIPVWSGDSLSFLALTAEAARLASLPTSLGVAVQRQREAFLEVTQLWRSEIPGDANAAEAVAEALAMLGDAAAIDTLRIARTLATTRDDGARIAAAEVFVRLKFALPFDTTGVAGARALADSLLRAYRPEDQRGVMVLASLAALTGRAGLAATYATRGDMDSPPRAIASSAPALLAFASLGGSADSLESLEAQVDRGIRSLPAPEQSRQRKNWLLRAAALAFPDYRLHALTEGDATQSRTARLIAAAAAGDADDVHRGIAELADARRLMRVEERTIDGAFPESAALWAVGDYQGAAEWLDPVLGALRSLSPRDLATVARAGSLVRAMVLRAKIAEQLNDVPTARRFSAAVVVLWSGADPFLQETVRGMKRLAR